MFEMPSDLDRPWEPWTPQLGDRVRVLTHGECRARMPDDDEPFHPPDMVGRIGVVSYFLPDSMIKLGVKGHRFRIHFAQPIIDPKDGHEYCCAWYAAIELEPLEDNRA